MNEDPVRVLITEDSPLVAQMIEGMLQESGYEVVGIASDGADALRLTQSLRPSVVIMDIEMPGMNGLDATRRIQEIWPTPVVILSSHDTQGLVQQARDAGAGAYLIKPPGAREIERAILIAIARFEDLVALKRLNADLETRNRELEQALATVKVLSGLLPICAACKSIRDDKGYWQQVDVYLREHSDLRITHGICPDCAQKLYPGLNAVGRRSGDAGGAGST